MHHQEESVQHSALFQSHHQNLSLGSERLRAGTNNIHKIFRSVSNSMKPDNGSVFEVVCRNLLFGKGLLNSHRWSKYMESGDVINLNSALGIPTGSALKNELKSYLVEFCLIVTPTDQINDL